MLLWFVFSADNEMTPLNVHVKHRIGAWKREKHRQGKLVNEGGQKVPEVYTV